MKKKLGLVSGAVLGFMPLMAFAQGATCNSYLQSGTIEYIICRIGDILNILIPILIILGVVYFIWGVVQFVVSSDEEAKTKGRTHMIYGIIGLVVIIAIWGLVGIVRNTFGLNSGPQAPATPFVNY